MTTASGLALPARAKLNLELDVIKRRADGFHELRTIFQAIDLHDLLELRQADTTSLVLTGLEVPGAGENAVLVAHRRLENAVNRKLPTMFRLHKRVPAGSGMGGASSDAAAALRGLKSLFRLDVDLESVARDVGADVPFFLRGGAATATGHGEVLRPMDPAHAWFAIAWPGFALSTAAVYKAWDEVGGEAPNELRRAAEKVDPRLKDFARQLDGGDPGGRWQLTGSGSAFFRLCSSHADAVDAIAPLSCWKAASCAVDAWA